MVTKDMDFSFGKLTDPGTVSRRPAPVQPEACIRRPGVKPIQAAKTMRGPDRNDTVIDFR
jgi:hypothetical protein